MQVLFYHAIIGFVLVVGFAVLVARIKYRKFISSLLGLYILFVVCATIILRPSFSVRHVISNPFGKYIEIIDSIKANCHESGLSGVWKGLKTNERVITEILLNLLLFVPFGYLFPFVYDKMQKWWKVMLLGFGFSLVIEVTQLFSLHGCFDISDLLLNSLGAGLGFFSWQTWMAESPERKKGIKLVQ